MRMPRIMSGNDISHGLTFDIPYIGPDGPSYSGVTKGDYLGIYVRPIGAMDLGSLLGGAPASLDSLYPDTRVIFPGSFGGNFVDLSASDMKSLGFSHSNIEFRWEGSSEVEDPDELFYTYRIDRGLWHPPTRRKFVKYPYLPDGFHTFEVASIHHIGAHQFIDPTPATVKFVIDTTPPEIEFSSGTKFREGDNIKVSVDDYPHRPERVDISWSIDGKKFTPWADTRVIPVVGLADGVHRIVVKAKDAAGNIGSKGMIFEITGESGFGCSSGGSVGEEAIFLLFIFIVAFVGKRYIAKSGKRS